MKSIVYGLVSLIVLFAGRDVSADFIAVQTANTPNEDAWTVTAGAIYGGTVGWSFQVGSQDILVTQLGLYDSGLDGLLDAHQVGLWDNGGTLLTSVSLPAGTGGALVGSYRYMPTSNVTLLSGQTYILGSFFPGGSAENIITFSSQTFDPNITFVQSRQNTIGLGSSFGFPNINAGLEQGAFGPNFQFQTAAAPVPEPSSLLLAGIGVVVATTEFRRRRKIGAPY